MALFGGSSSSNSTTNTDARVVGAENSSNLSLNGNTGTTVNVTDNFAVEGALALGGQALNANSRVVDDYLSLAHGTSKDALTFGANTVSEGIKLAIAGIEGANKQSLASQQQATSLVGAALSNAGDQANAFTNTIKDIKTSDVRVLVIAGLAVVGLGAFLFLRKAA